MNTTLIPAAIGSVNFASAWSTFWGVISSQFSGPIATTLTTIGVLMVVASIGMFIFRKRRGGGGTQGIGHIVATMTIGGALAAPNVIIPLLLLIADVILNFGIGAANGIWH